MVFIGELKYACETCIKGHRSSTCKHTDRPLFEIKKKGRPITQCDHCRELRKTKQVHVKCLCEHKDDGEGPSSISKGVKKLPASATFPGGLPDALEASVALQRLSEATDSGRNGSGTPTSSCDCKTDGSCQCCIPRTATSTSKKQAKEKIPSRIDNAATHRDNDGVPSVRPAGLVAVANSGHHRPVLPRPSPQRQASPSGPVHDPSQPAHAHANRHQSHSDHFFSPYGRAYEHTHGAELALQTSPLESTVSSSAYPSSESDPPPLPTFIPSFCGCGPDCACPGCIVHRGSAAQPSMTSSCMNPNDCAACFDCNFLSVPPVLPPSTPLPEISDAQYQSIDDWVRQLDAAPGYGASDAPLPDSSLPSEQPGYAPQGQGDVRYDPASWQTYALWGSLQDHRTPQSAPQECCGGQCQCAPGGCSCAADCCGCCQGCQCSEHRSGELEHCSGHKSLTFAESGIRDACCGGTVSESLGQNLQQPLMPFPTPAVSGSRSQDLFPNGTWTNSSLVVPRTISRASSTSSYASSEHSRSTSSNGSVRSARDNAAIQSCCNSMQDVGTSSPQPPLSSGPTVADQHRTLNSSEFGFLF